MAKAKPKILNQSSAMERILGVSKAETPELPEKTEHLPTLDSANVAASGIAAAVKSDMQENEAAAKTVAAEIAATDNEPQKENADAADETHKEPQKESKKGRAAKTPKEKYIQTAFYITAKQRKALKLRAARSDEPAEKDLSAIVRTAIDAYLGL